MLMFPIRAKYIDYCLTGPVTRRCADKACRVFTGKTLSSIARTYDKKGIINIKAIKYAWRKFIGV